MIMMLPWVKGVAHASEPDSHITGEKRIPKALVRLGHQNEFALLVEKKSQQLFIYNNDFSLIKVISVTTGMQQGDKERSGDKRTPEGIYFFSAIKEDEELLPKYGIMALTLNYPNVIDARENKRGYGIWLHATDQPARAFKQFDTLGCVVVVNEDMIEISKYVSMETTPIVIEDEIRYASDASRQQLEKAMSDLVSQWKNAWQTKNIEKYISLYSERFKFDGMNKTEWKQYKQKLNRRYSRIDVTVTDLDIILHDDYAVVVFIQRYQSNMFKSKGVKRLYMVPENNGWKIIGEEWQEIQHTRPWQIARKYSTAVAELDEKPGVKREQWIKSKNPSHYALQLLGVSNEDQLIGFINKYGLNDKVGYFKTRLNGKEWWVLIYGEYKSMNDAKSATETLPEYLKHPSPWVRTYKSIQQTIDQSKQIN